MSCYDSQNPETLLRNTWVSRFIAVGGFGKLLEVYKKYSVFQPGLSEG
jgi:hypothetical protein